MHRIDGAGATLDHLFTEGNPTTATPATKVTGAWLTAVQEEIAYVIEQAGDALDKPDNTQLYTAIAALIAAASQFVVASQAEAEAGTNNTKGMTPLRVAQAIAKLAIPVGFIMPMAVNIVPAGFVKCNGAALSRSTYNVLWSTIGSTWGVGDGISTFNVPDARGEFMRGWDDGRGVDAGRVLGAWQEATLFGVSTAGAGGMPVGSIFRGGDNFEPTGAANFSVSSLTAQGSETFTPSRVRPRNFAPLFCIKY